MIRGKPVVSRQVFAGLLPELKGRAFTVSGIEYAGVMQSIRDRIADLPEGALWDDVKGDIASDMIPYIVDSEADAVTRDAQLKAAIRRAELLLRIHGFQAYANSAYEVAQRQKDVLPYWQYHSMEDSRVRPSHAALDGVVLPADSPFWSDHYPPWEWGCRCLITPISKEDADRLRNEDASKAPEEQRILEGAQLSKLEQEGILIRKNGTFNVTSGFAKGDKGAFFWDPATLRMPIERLKARYDPETWAGFEKFARSTRLQSGEDRTVWDWLSEGPRIPRGGKTPAAPAPSPAPTPEAPAPTPAAPVVDEQKWPIDVAKTIADLRIQDVAKSIADLPREVFVVLERTPAGMKEKYARHLSGQYGGEIPAHWQLAGCTLVHNHPSGIDPKNKGYGSSFSVEDVKSMLGLKLAEMVAASPKRVYRIRPPAELPDPKKMNEAFFDATMKVGNWLNHRALNQLTPLWKLNQVRAHMIWKAFARQLGFMYTVEKRRT